MKDLGYDGASNWEFARVMLYVTLVLLVVMAVLMIVKFLVNRPVLKWSTFGAAVAAAVCALIFLVEVLVGCNSLNDVSLVSTFYAGVGTFIVSICAITSSVLSMVVSLRK